MEQLKPIAKAVSSFATTFVLTGAAFTTDGELSFVEVLIAAAMGLGGGAVVWRVPNKPGKHEVKGPVAE